jgi:hypothetical protein
MTGHHLLTVWNPAYEQDAMELHLSCAAGCGTAGHRRRQLMGVGCEGEFVKLARVT